MLEATDAMAEEASHGQAEHGGRPRLPCMLTFHRQAFYFYFFHREKGSATLASRLQRLETQDTSVPPRLLVVRTRSKRPGDPHALLAAWTPRPQTSTLTPGSSPGLLTCRSGVQPTALPSWAPSKGSCGRAGPGEASRGK